MDRRTMNTVVRAMGGRIIDSDTATVWYEFPTDEKTLTFREMLPYRNLWASVYTPGYSPQLIVYLDKLKDY